MTVTLLTLRDRFEKLRSNELFETFVILVIIISALMIGIVLETLQQEHEQFSRDSGEGNSLA